jgi:hypothetical protein|nr:MAG TPA: hypothetical protein [Caudoviricetes sp.]
MLEFVTRWLVCLALLAIVVQSERTIKDMANNLFEKRQAMLVWLFINVCLVVCTAVVMGWM